jgi:hypothetical protein
MPTTLWRGGGRRRTKSRRGKKMNACLILPIGKTLDHLIIKALHTHVASFSYVTNIIVDMLQVGRRRRRR